MPEANIILETDRLILRRYCAEDLRDLYEILCDEDVIRFEPYRSMNITETEEDLEQKISSDEMIAVVLKENRKLIGNVYLEKKIFTLLKSGMCSVVDIGGRVMPGKAVQPWSRKRFRKTHTGYTPSAIRRIPHRGGCLNGWALKGKLI